MEIIEQRTGTVAFVSDPAGFYLVVGIPEPDAKTIIFQAQKGEPWKEVVGVRKVLSPTEAVEYVKNRT